jgi:DNA-binding winged helix-turn-helix (wHTH) protein/tetratricopeptide (TPR) repeat protein
MINMVRGDLRVKLRPGPDVVTFGAFRIDCALRRLSRDGRRIRIQRKPLDVLIYLATHAGRIVTRAELLQTFWRSGVHEEALTRCISIVRKVLDDAREPPRYIETVWGQGYRFIAPVSQGVEAVPPGAAHPESAADPDPRPLGPHQPRYPVAVRRWRRSLGVAAAIGLVALIATFWWRTTERGAKPPVERIAILPMVWESPSDQWLAEALTDHLAQTVARIEGVTVIAHFAAESGSEPEDPRVSGRRLNVGAVLASQIVRTGEGFGLRARLTATDDGSVLWSFTLPPVSEDPGPEMIEQLAASIARRLWANLRQELTAAEVDPAAYRQYLRGRYYWNQRSGTGLYEAIDSFQSALSLEPGYADAWVGLADSWLLLPLYGAVPPTRAIPRARQAATRALEVDRRSARALAVLGVIAMQYDWDWTTAEALLRQALTHNPNDATTEQWLGELYCYRHRFVECRRHLQAAAGLDPLSPVLRMLQASPALWSGDFATAVAAYRRALDEAPGVPMALYSLGLSHAGLEEWTSAIENYRAAQPDLGLEIVGGPLVYALARGGEPARAEALFVELERRAEEHYVPPSKFAIAWLGLGERTRAIEWLERAVEARDDRLVYLAVDPHFRELHTEPAFHAVAERVGLLDLFERR